MKKETKKERYRLTPRIQHHYFADFVLAVINKKHLMDFQIFFRVLQEFKVRIDKKIAKKQDKGLLFLLYSQVPNKSVVYKRLGWKF